MRITKTFYLFSLTCSFSFFCLGEITQEQLAGIFKQHCSTLQNTAIEQKPLVVVFSGVPGMGKSTVAKKLEQEYKAIRVSTDQLRDLFREKTSITEADFDDALQKYVGYFFAHYNMPNKRLILDASIDRKYVTLFPFFEQHKINFIVVRLDVPRDIVVKRLNEREGTRAAWFLKNLDAWFADHHNFASNYTNYISYNNLDTSDFASLKQNIDKKIASFQEQPII